MIAFEIPLGYAILDNSVAAAGSSQGNATQLRGLTCIITTALASGGVMIGPELKITQIIYNSTAVTVNVWPKVGMSLWPLAVNTAIQLSPGRAIGVVVADNANAYVIFNSSSFG